MSDQMALLTTIPAKQEDVASATLVYLLNKEPALNTIWENLIGAEAKAGTWKTQIPISLEDGNQGFLDAIYEDDSSAIVVEAKFWADFTDNQPDEYLKWMTKELCGKKQHFVLLVPSNRILETTQHTSAKVKKSLGADLVWNDAPNPSAILGEIRLAVVDWRHVESELQTCRSSLALTATLEVYLSELVALLKAQLGNPIPPFEEQQLGFNTARLFRRILDVGFRAFDQFRSRRSDEDIKFGKYAGGWEDPWHLFYGNTFSAKAGKYWFGLNLGFWSEFGVGPYWLIALDASSGKELTSRTTCQRDTYGRYFVNIPVLCNMNEEQMVASIVARLEFLLS